MDKAYRKVNKAKELFDLKLIDPITFKEEIVNFYKTLGFKDAHNKEKKFFKFYHYGTII